MSEPTDKSQPHRREEGVKSFLAMPPVGRYLAMEIGLQAKGHIADEVLFAVARRAESEGWSDKRKYTQQLMHRIYRHVKAHVAKNLAWQRYGGGFEATVDDCAQFVAGKLALVPADAAFGEIAFGGLVYKRCLDFADTLFNDFQKKRVTDDPDQDGVEDLEGDDNLYSPELYEEQIRARFEKESREDLNLQRIHAFVQEEGFLSEHERIAFTYHWFGKIHIHSKEADKLTICKLMGRSDKSVRLYLERALAKIKERLQ